MNSCDSEYFVAFPPNDSTGIRAIPDDRTADRNYGIERDLSGKPFRFYESAPREGFEQSIDRKLSDVFFNAPEFAVADWLKAEIVKYPIRSCQLVPTTLIDCQGNSHDHFWFLNIYEPLEVLDLDKSDIRGDREAYRVQLLEERRVKVRRTSLDCSQLHRIPRKERMIFRIDSVALPMVFVHEELVNLFLRRQATGICFFRVSDFVEGMQHY